MLQLKAGMLKKATVKHIESDGTYDTKVFGTTVKWGITILLITSNPGQIASLGFQVDLAC